MNKVYKFELLNYCSRIKGRLFVFGAGECGKKTIHFLLDNGVIVSSIIVSQKDEKLDAILNITINQIGDVIFNSNDGVILGLANDNPDIDSVTESLVTKGANPCNIYLQRVFFHSLSRPNTASVSGFFSDYHTLDDIGEKYGTDKCRKHHNFLNKYEFILSKYRDKPITLVEFGVLRGDSLRMWKEFFHNGNIIGIDIDEICEQYAEERVDVRIGDLGDKDFLERLVELRPTVIVDDASHKWSHQINTICTMFPAMKEGGVYIVEDIMTSFMDEEGYNDAIISAYEFCSAVSECVSGNTTLWSRNHRYEVSLYSQQIEKIAEEVELISFIFGSCILIKK